MNLPQEKSAEGVQRFADEIAALKEENRDLQTRNIRLQLSAVPEGQTGNLFRFTDPLPNIAQRNFVNGLCEKTSGFAGRLIVMGDPEIRLGDGRIEWADGGLVRDIGAISGEIDKRISAYLTARSANTHNGG